MSTYLNGATASVAVVQNQITRVEFSAAPISRNNTTQSDQYVNQNSPAFQGTYTLTANADTTIAIPANCTMVSIYAPTGNTNAITVRHTGMSVGWSMNALGFFCASLPSTSTPANLIINNTGAALANVQISFD